MRITVVGTGYVGLSLAALLLNKEQSNCFRYKQKE